MDVDFRGSGFWKLIDTLRDKFGKRINPRGQGKHGKGHARPHAYRAALNSRRKAQRQARRQARLQVAGRKHRGK
jgi:hypothetical protein